MCTRRLYTPEHNMMENFEMHVEDMSYIFELGLIILYILYQQVRLRIRER